MNETLQAIIEVEALHGKEAAQMLLELAAVGDTLDAEEADHG